MILVSQVFYEKLKVLGQDLLFGGASIAVILFTIAAAVLLSYPKFMMKFEKVAAGSSKVVDVEEAEPRDPNRLLVDPPFEPTSVTEHSTELLKDRR